MFDSPTAHACFPLCEYFSKAFASDSVANYAKLRATHTSGRLHQMGETTFRPPLHYLAKVSLIHLIGASNQQTARSLRLLIIRRLPALRERRRIFTDFIPEFHKRIISLSLA